MMYKVNGKIKLKNGEIEEHLIDYIDSEEELEDTICELAMLAVIKGGRLIQPVEIEEY